MKINDRLLITIVSVSTSLILQLGYLHYVSNYVDKKDLGDFVILLTYLSGLSFIILQIPLSSFNRFYNNSDDKNEFNSQYTSIIFIFSLVALLTFYLINVFFLNLSYIFVLFIISSIIFSSLVSLRKSRVLLDKDSRQTFILHLFDAISKFLLPIIFYSYFEDVFALLFGYVLGYFITFIISSKNLSLSFDFDLDPLISQLKFAYPTITTSFFAWGILYSDRYFILNFLSSESVGIYAIIFQTTSFLFLLNQIYGMYVNPIAYQLDAKKDHCFSTISKYINYFVILLLFILIIFICLAEYTPLISFMISSDVFSTYKLELYILLFASLLTVLQNSQAMYFVMFKKLHVISYIYAIGFILNLLGNLFIQKYGILAAAISTLLAYSIIVFAQHIYIKRVIRDLALNDYL